MSTRSGRRNRVSDGFVSVELGSVESLSVDSTVNFISWASISEFDKVVAEFVEFRDDVRAGLSNIGLSAFDGRWVAGESSLAGALESALVVGAHARWSAVVSSSLALVDISAAISFSSSVALEANWARALEATIDVVTASSWSARVVKALVDVSAAERSRPVRRTDTSRLIVGINFACSQVAVDRHAWIAHNIAEWTAISIIALASVSLALGVIKNAFSGDACVFEAFRQVFFCQ